MATTKLASARRSYEKIRHCDGQDIERRLGVQLACAYFLGGCVDERQATRHKPTALNIGAKSSFAPPAHDQAADHRSRALVRAAHRFTAQLRRGDRAYRLVPADLRPTLSEETLQSG
jgi:hypothetical protein